MPAERGTAPRRGAWLREVWHSSVGKKVIVAITGAVLALYVIAHVLGNLKAFQGAGAGEPAINAYGEWLRTVGEPAIPRDGALWALRVVLLGSLLIHIVGVVQLHGRNREARPTGYPAPRIRRSFAAQTMLWGGLALLAFIVFHILHFTTGTIDPGGVFVGGNVFGNMTEAFENPFFVAIYVAAAGLIGLHLYHGLWSAVQTAGWDKPNRNPTFRRAASATSILVAVGFAAVPLAFFTGVL
jgi:succinate dehydrogenase / fumarate reductase cytochrome b subunit